MKKLFAIILALVMVLGAFAGCSKQAPSSSEPEERSNIVKHSFDYEGVKCDVEIDVSDGWSCDFGNLAVYLFNEEMTDESEAVSHGFPLSNEEYEERIKDIKEHLTWEEVGAGIIGVSEDGRTEYAYRVSDDLGFLITVNPGIDTTEVFSRYMVYPAA